MDIICNWKRTLVCVVLFISCLEASPVPKTLGNKGTGPEDSSPHLSEDGINIVKQENTKGGDGAGSGQAGHSGNPDGVAMPNTQETSQSVLKQVSQAFTKKVLEAFFDELKKRPDLIDEILRRETYQMLMMNYGPMADGNVYKHSPSTGTGLTQQLDGLETIPNMQPIGNDMSVSETTRYVNPDGEQYQQGSTENVAIAKKDKTANVKGSEDSSKQTKEENSVRNAAGVKGALVAKLAPTSEQSVDITGQGLEDGYDPEPYYYYVYYDDADVPKSDKEATVQYPPPSNNSNVVDNTKAVIITNDKTRDDSANTMNKLPSTNYNKKAQQQSGGHAVDKLVVSAMGSVLAKDMENQLDKSKSAMRREGINKDDSAQQAEFVKSGREQTEEEMQLTKLI